MSKYTDGKVQKAKSSQQDLIDSGERLSADPDKMSTIGVSVGMQVRVSRDSSADMALYTFYEEMEEVYSSNARMGYSGRARLAQTSTPILVDVDSQVVHPTYDEAEAEANSEFIEQLDERESSSSDARLCAIAPHGGNIESFTAEQAERVFSQLNDADKDVDCWRCKGFKSGGGAFDRWHITSDELDKRSFPKLASIADKGFDYCVAFHGMSEDGIIIGGLASTALKTEIKEAIEDALDGSGIDVVLWASGSYGGQAEGNLVNWLCGGDGVQIEQSYEARSEHWQAIADAVAGVFASKL